MNSECIGVTGVIPLRPDPSSPLFTTSTEICEEREGPCEPGHPPFSLYKRTLLAIISLYDSPGFPTAALLHVQPEGNGCPVVALRAVGLRILVDLFGRDF